MEELRAKDGIYDSLIITYDSTYITRRLSLSEYGVLSILDTPVIEELEEIHIELFEGDNYIYLSDMEGNRFYAEYVVKNDFTDVFVTINVMNSAITQTAEKIELSVSQILEDYSTTEEMNSIISQTAQEINLEVSKKVGEDEIISKINQSAEAVTVDASKIGLTASDILSLIAGNTINLTSRNIVITSDNFSVDASGNLVANNANLNSASFNSDKLTIDADGKITITADNTSSSNQFFVVNNPNGEIVRLYGDGIAVGYGSNSTTVINEGIIECIFSNASLSEVASMSVTGLNVYTESGSSFEQTLVRASGIQTPVIRDTSGRYAVMGYNSSNRYYLYWNGTTLYFYVDNTNVGSLSDSRLKTDIDVIDDNLLSIFEKLEIKKFKLKNRSDRTSFGIIAQELIEICEKYDIDINKYNLIDEVPYELDSEELYYNVDYEQLLILYNKFLKNKVDSLEKKLTEQENTINLLIERIEKIENKEETTNG